jgi:hypothetical protein
MQTLDRTAVQLQDDQIDYTLDAKYLKCERFARGNLGLKKACNLSTNYGLMSTDRNPNLFQVNRLLF